MGGRQSVRGFWQATVVAQGARVVIPLSFPGAFLSRDFSAGQAVTILVNISLLVLDGEIAGLGYARDPKKIAAGCL
jgi:hypothetical protein